MKTIILATIFSLGVQFCHSQNCEVNKVYTAYRGDSNSVIKSFYVMAEKNKAFDHVLLLSIMVR